MEFNGQSSPQENVDANTKATFRKPTNDAGNRKYRRRSPVSGSSSSDGSPIHERKSSPIPSSKGPERGTGDRRRKDDVRDLDRDRDSGRSQYGRSGNSYRHSDRDSSRSSLSYHRHDDYHRRDKYEDDDRDYSRSSRTSRDSKSNNFSDHSRRENEYRSRDHPRDVDKYSRDKSDGQVHRSRDKERESLSLENQKHKKKDLSSDRVGSGRRHTSSMNEDVKSGKDRYKEDKVGQDNKIDYRRSAGDYKNDCSPAYEDSRNQKNETTSRMDISGHPLKESFRSDHKKLGGEKYATEENKNYEDMVKYKECHYKEAEEQFEDRKVYSGKDQESSSKKPKLYNLDGSTSNGKDVTEVKATGDDKRAQEPASTVASEWALTDSDIDAAKIAAMKAAELVNRNLIGTGYMSADQKKKLLWGNKKTTATEESGHHWDTAIFGDRERQEKFNKLMSLRLHWCLWPIVGCEGGSESGTQARQSRCREAEGATAVGFREAVHSWASSKRWSHCWTRSLMICFLHFLHVYVEVFSSILLYYWARYFNVAPLLLRISDLCLKFMSVIANFLTRYHMHL